jgi:hypothetical protein
MAITVFLLMSNHFTIKIPCKRYVKAYLENNCGTPVDLHHLPSMMEELKRGLSKKPEHMENKNLAEYDQNVTIIIPSDYFYRYGWELNKENILDFNRKAEMLAKFNMRQFILLNRGLGVPVSTCIREFQEMYDFPEQVWSSDSIKKDFDRHGEIAALKTVKELKQEINKILLGNLSDLGTISKKFKKECIYG